MARKNKNAEKSLVAIYNLARKSTEVDGDGNKVPALEVAIKALRQMYPTKMEKLTGTKLTDFAKSKMNQARGALKRRIVKVDGKNVQVTREKDETNEEVTHIFAVRVDEKGKVIKGLDGKVIKEKELIEGEYKEIDPPALWESSKKNSEDELLNFMFEASADL